MHRSRCVSVFFSDGPNIADESLAISAADEWASG
jgi:hypothetical protein